MPTEQTIKALVNSAALKLLWAVISVTFLAACWATKMQMDMEYMKRSLEELKTQVAASNGRVEAIATETRKLAWNVDAHERRLAWVERKKP